MSAGKRVNKNCVGRGIKISFGQKFSLSGASSGGIGIRCTLKEKVGHFVSFAKSISDEKIVKCTV